jgi:hypothetical protein
MVDRCSNRRGDQTSYTFGTGDLMQVQYTVCILSLQGKPKKRYIRLRMYRFIVNFYCKFRTDLKFCLSYFFEYLHLAQNLVGLIQILTNDGSKLHDSEKRA